MKHLLTAIQAMLLFMPLHAQTFSTAPQATECLQGNVSYFEETTYNVWSIRFNSPDSKDGEQTVQTIKRPESIVCHEFDAQGHETVTTRYVQRDANVGSIGRDEDGNIDFIANEISRSTPDTRTVMEYDNNGKLISTKTWSFNLGDSTLVATSSDSINNTFKYDSDHFLIRYIDQDGMTVKYYYNERGNLVRQSSEWKDGGVLNYVFEDFEYDDYGNWIRCVRKLKDPGEAPRSTKIIERSFIYR